MPPPYTAQFRIDQTGGGGPGSPGIARIDLWRTLRIDLTPTNPPPGATYEWNMVRPRGSSAVFLDPGTGLPNPNHATPYFIPDVWGSYLVQCSINNGQHTFKLIAATKFDADGTLMKLGWRYPALNEDWLNASDPYGWKQAIEDIFDSLFGVISSLQGHGGHSGDDGGETRAADAVVQAERRVRLRDIRTNCAQDDASFILTSVIDQKQLGQSVVQLANFVRDDGFGPVPGSGLAIIDSADESLKFVIPLSLLLVPAPFASITPLCISTFGTQVAVAMQEAVVVVELGKQLLEGEYSEPDIAILFNPDAGGGFGDECRVAFGVDRGVPRVFISDKQQDKIYTTQVNLPAPLAGVLVP
jgi:hypothetical protein